jgi:nitric oxide reductase NorE protein
MWIFLLGDMMVFALLFGVYLDNHQRQLALFDRSQLRLDPTYGAVNTLLLLTASLFVARAVAVMRRGTPSAGTREIWCALTCGLGFGVVKSVEWGEKLSAGLHPSTNHFFMFYFVLTGLHFFHYVIGMGMLLFIRRLSRRSELSARQVVYLEGAACFWHMVDLLWLVLFPLLYLVR